MTLNLETDQETWSVRFPHDEKLKYPKSLTLNWKKKYVEKSSVAGEVVARDKVLFLDDLSKE